MSLADLRLPGRALRAPPAPPAEWLVSLWRALSRPYRRLRLRRRLEALPERLLRDVGIEPAELDALVRRVER